MFEVNISLHFVKALYTNHAKMSDFNEIKENRTSCRNLNYSSFHKTLPRSSLQMNWFSVRFYEMGESTEGAGTKFSQNINVKGLFISRNGNIDGTLCPPPWL